MLPRIDMIQLEKEGAKLHFHIGWFCFTESKMWSCLTAGITDVPSKGVTLTRQRKSSSSQAKSWPEKSAGGLFPISGVLLYHSAYLLLFLCTLFPKQCNRFPCSKSLARSCLSQGLGYLGFPAVCWVGFRLCHQIYCR